jgi:ParB family transcriptional regulator, chromosome partitioning protein
MTKRKLLLSNNPLLSGPALVERDRTGVPYREIAIANIDRDPNQPRVHFDEEKLQDLSSSIRMYGVLSPILVKPAKIPGRYTLISGERRFRASQLAGLSTIPAIVDLSSESSTERTLAMQLVENIQRADLSPLERAQAIGMLKDAFNLSVREIGEKLGVSKSMVQRSLQIRELPDDLLNALREGASESKVLLLADIEDPEIRASYLKGLDVEVKRPGAMGSQKVGGEVNPEDERIAEEIQRALGVKVKMTRPTRDSESGRLIIDFYSDADLQEIFRKLVADGL